MLYGYIGMQVNYTLNFLES